MSETQNAKQTEDQKRIRKQRVDAPPQHQQTFALADVDLQQRGPGAFSRAAPSSDVMSREPSSLMSRAPSSIMSRAPSALLQRQPSAFGRPGSEPQPQPVYPHLTFRGRDFADIPAGELNRPVVQPKLMVGPANNRYEQEADRMAAQVMSTPTPPQASPAGDHGQVQRAEADDLAQVKPHRQAKSDAGFEPDSVFETQFSSQRGGGSPLPDPLRADFEPKFGADFSGVRVHTDAQSDQLNQAIQAKAFTTGQDVFFRQGEYQPGSRGGQALIAHELTHVVQQNGGVVGRSPLPPQPWPQHPATETPSSSVGDRVIQAKGEKELTSSEASVGGRIAQLTNPNAQNNKGHSNPPVFSDVNRGMIQRTIWAWNDKDKRWDIIQETSNREEPPYIGKAGDFHDNEGTLGKFDLNAEEAAHAKALVLKGSELAGLTMVEIMQQAFADAGLAKKFQKDDELFNLLLDIGRQEIDSMSLDAKVTKLPEYYRKPLAYTSCHNTANKLLIRMSATPKAPEAYTGSNKEAAQAAPNNDWMAAVAQGLGDGIANDVANLQRAIYEVHCGGHGFAIIVRNKTIEIVQSFANAVGLVERMQRGPLMCGAGQIKALTADLASASIAERNRAAQFIADCNADVFGLMPNPHSWQYRWRRHALKNEALILEEFRADIKAGFKAVKPILFMK